MTGAYLQEAKDPLGSIVLVGLGKRRVEATTLSGAPP